MVGSHKLVLFRVLASGFVAAVLASGAQASAADEHPDGNGKAVVNVTLARAEPVRVVQAVGWQGQAGEEANPVAHVTVGRAADLVGQPMDIFRPITLAGANGVPAGMPVAAARLTSGFGLRQHPILGGWREHLGVDLAAPYGSPIVATDDGVVGRARRAGGYGLSVSIDGPGGIETRYGHMSRLAVSKGETVRKGEVIGYVGSTGLSTGPHLHYEVRINGRAVNPLPYIRKK